MMKASKEILDFAKAKLSEAESQLSEQARPHYNAMTVNCLIARKCAYKELISFIGEDKPEPSEGGGLETLGKIEDPYREQKGKLKAFEIIKEKEVDLGSLLFYIRSSNHPLAFYNKGIVNEKKKLTKDEFDLLKEILK